MTEKNTQKRRRAYSYLRFSTPEQAKGNSFKRQTDMAAKYAAEHGLILDNELVFHDRGVSAFRGANATTGRVGDFLEAVQAGEVPPGSVLLVESLDRISRDAVFQAQTLLSSIIMKGVAVVTLIDGREYSLATVQAEPLSLVYSLLAFMRANEESSTKSRRLKAAWEGKRAKLQSGKPLTSKAPAWLRLSDDRRAFGVIEERAELVRRVFSMTLAGAGQHKIAATFNEEGIAPWGRGSFWQRSYISKILENTAVLGEFTPHVMEIDLNGKRRRPLEPVAGYFPAIVPEEDFRQAQVLRQALGAPQRGRHANAPLTNFLAGLAACHKCGSTMTRVAKGNRSRPAYVCTRAKAKTRGQASCVYKSVWCERIEQALIWRLAPLLRDLEGVGGKDAGLEGEIRQSEDQVAHLHNVIDGLLDDLAYVGRSEALRKRLMDAENELDEARDSLGKLKERQAAVTGPTVGARITRALEALEPANGEPDAAAVNLALRAIFKRAVIDWEGQLIHLEWTHGGTCLVPYSSFKEWPGPGWVWSQEEEIDEE